MLFCHMFADFVIRDIQIHLGVAFFCHTETKFLWYVALWMNSPNKLGEGKIGHYNYTFGETAVFL